MSKMAKKIDKKTEQIKLTLPMPIYNKLKEEKNRFSYQSIQSIILEALRERYYKKKTEGKSRRGRPPELDLVKIATRKSFS